MIGQSIYFFEVGIPNVLPFVDNINEILVPSQSVEEYKNRLTSYADKIKENQIHDASK